MSKQRRHDEKPDRPGAEGSRAAQRASGRRSHIVGDLLLIFGSFVLASAIAGLLGAPNLGTALSFGQIALAITVVYVLLRR